MRRLLALVLLAVAATACASAELERSDVAGVVADAFDDAGADVNTIEVATEPVDGRWPVEAQLGGRPISLEVDADSGRVVSIDFGVDATPLTQAQLEDLAAHEDNPAADRARRQQLLIIFAVLGASMAAGLLVARQLRLREEAAASAEAPAETPADA